MNQSQATNKFQISFVDSIEQVNATAWNEITNTNNPFMRYEFLHALESTGCTTEQTGWKPHHAVVHIAGRNKSLIAVMPLYLKTNSWGESILFYRAEGAFRI